VGKDGGQYEGDQEGEIRAWSQFIEFKDLNVEEIKSRRG
jgi:hypothetical protein